MLDLFATRLKEERARLGFNQEDFANLGGVSKNTQLAYEQGIRVPDVHYLFKIEDNGADLLYLLERGKEWSRLSPTITEMITLFKTLPVPQQALAFGVMAMLGDASIEKNGGVEEVWRNARLLRQFMAATDEEKTVVEKTLAALHDKNAT